MDRSKMITKRHGYELSVAASALQKAIRRQEVALAGHFALEIFESGYREYVWRRLLIISAEDCFGLITHEIEALYRTWKMLHANRAGSGRICVSKAVILLALSLKSRDADHLQCLVHDQDLIDAHARDVLLKEAESDRVEVPEWAYDIHTAEGRRRGKTREDFIRDEHSALKPRQIGLFDHLVDGGKHA